MKNNIYNIKDYVRFILPNSKGVEVQSGIIVRKFFGKIDGAYGKYDYMFDIRTNPLNVCKNIPKENIIKKFENTNTTEEEKEENVKMDFVPVKVIYNRYATIVFWKDGTKTVVKVSKDDTPSYYNGFCAALAKKVFETNSAVKRIVDEGFDELRGTKVKDIKGGNTGVVPSPPKNKPKTCNGCKLNVRFDNSRSFCRLADHDKPFIEDGDGIPDYCPFDKGKEK